MLWCPVMKSGIQIWYRPSFKYSCKYFFLYRLRFFCRSVFSDEWMFWNCRKVSKRSFSCSSQRAYLGFSCRSLSCWKDNTRLRNGLVYRPIPEACTCLSNTCEKRRVAWWMVDSHADRRPFHSRSVYQIDAIIRLYLFIYLFIYYEIVQIMYKSVK